MTRFIYIPLLFILNSLTGCDMQNTDIISSSYHTFEGTPAWALAQAVKDEDTNAIKKILKDSKISVNYQSPKFGCTLLTLSTFHQQINSMQVLLELGADPNIRDSDYETPVIIAAKADPYGKNEVKYLKLLLDFGGDVNTKVEKPQPGTNTFYTTALIEACAGKIEKVKLLLERGADINYTTIDGNTALNTTLSLDNIEITLFLLKKGADYTKPFKDIEGKKYYISDALRLMLFEIGSEQYEQKMQAVAFLKNHGIDYHKSAIPDFVLEKVKRLRPNDWQQYLDKY